jgi:cysteine desulfurase
MYGPKGVGVLYVRRKNPRVTLKAQLDGGGQERGFRSGTLNVPGIVGFGKAAAIAGGEMNENAEQIGRLRDLLEEGLYRLIAELNGNFLDRLVTNILFGHAGNLPACGVKRLAVSSRLFCHTTSQTIKC